MPKKTNDRQTPGRRWAGQGQATPDQAKPSRVYKFKSWEGATPSNEEHRNCARRPANVKGQTRHGESATPNDDKQKANAWTLGRTLGQARPSRAGQSSKTDQNMTRTAARNRPFLFGEAGLGLAGLGGAPKQTKTRQHWQLEIGHFSSGKPSGQNGRLGRIGPGRAGTIPLFAHTLNNALALRASQKTENIYFL